MTSLPVLSGQQVLAALANAGFERVSQHGSHVKVRRAGRTVIVPNHREVRRGTLASILRQAGMTVDEFQAFLG